MSATKLLDAVTAAKAFMDAEQDFKMHLGRKVSYGGKELGAAIERAERYKETKKLAKAAIKDALAKQPQEPKP